MCMWKGREACAHVLAKLSQSRHACCGQAVDTDARSRGSFQRADTFQIAGSGSINESQQR
eukprot:364836-Chlamydomonas_euryale.AAC.3